MLAVTSVIVEKCVSICFLTFIDVNPIIFILFCQLPLFYLKIFYGAIQIVALLLLLLLFTNHYKATINPFCMFFDFTL